VAGEWRVFSSLIKKAEGTHKKILERIIAAKLVKILLEVEK